MIDCLTDRLIIAHLDHFRNCLFVCREQLERLLQQRRSSFTHTHTHTHTLVTPRQHASSATRHASVAPSCSCDGARRRAVDARVAVRPAEDTCRPEARLSPRSPGSARRRRRHHRHRQLQQRKSQHNHQKDQYNINTKTILKNDNIFNRTSLSPVTIFLLLLPLLLVLCGLSPAAAPLVAL